VLELAVALTVLATGRVLLDNTVHLEMGESSPMHSCDAGGKRASLTMPPTVSC